jgi:hypothetical protein
MNNFFRALIAGYGAKKLGGGCLGTIVVFILIWVALGQCSFSSREIPPPETYPAKHRVCLPLVGPGLALSDDEPLSVAHYSDVSIGIVNLTLQAA